MFIIDTNIAIRLRDGDTKTIAQVAAYGVRPRISIVTMIELENGIAARPDLAAKRRASTDLMRSRLDVLPFGSPELDAYASIVEARGFSRSRILDRMIAATALVHGATLATLNPDDFRDVPGLVLEVWT